MSWQPPSWSIIPPPSQKWHLDEFKNGHLISTHSLNSLLATTSTTHNRTCLTFGRINDPTQIDIHTAHESCSRLHARLAFASNGVPYLKDLGSGNGTFVNTRQLPREACGKSEYTYENQKRGEVEVRGSRGVVLYPGDAIRFGCSTRLFVLEGPEQFERGSGSVVGVKNRVEEANDHGVIANDNNNSYNDEEQRTLRQDDVEQKEEEVCSWGISSTEYSEDQTNTNEQPSLHSNNDQQQSILNLPSIETFFNTPSKYTPTNALQQLYNQYQSKSHKHDAISTESKRISQKEDMGVELSDGQRNQLLKNNDKLIALEGALKGLREKIEEGMYVCIHGKPLSRSSVSGGKDEYDRAGGGEEDVDDFYDRTATSSTSKRQRDDNGGEAESEESLVQQWKILIQSHSKQQTVVSSTLKQSSVLQSQIDNTQDEEEVFFLQNDLNLVKDNVKKATRRLEEIEQEMKDVEQLLKIVNPKLSWDRGEGLIGTDLQIDNAKMAKDIASKNNSNERKKEEEIESEMMMPPPPKMASRSMDMPPPQPIVTDATNETKESSFDNMMPPPPKVPISTSKSTTYTSEHEVVTKHDHNSIQKEEVVKSSPPPPRKKRQLGPMRPPPSATGAQGTLAALQQFTSHSTSSTNNNDLRVKKQKTSNSDMPTTFDPRKDEWNAPTDQDGSGRTSLHDKFKGRY